VRFIGTRVVTRNFASKKEEKLFLWPKTKSIMHPSGGNPDARMWVSKMNYGIIRREKYEIIKNL